MKWPLVHRSIPFALLAVLLSASASASAAAQHAFATGADYDPAVPTPRTVLGYEIGERFTPHHLLIRYVERLAAASPRLRVDTVARTFEGRELLLVAVTGSANRARLDQIRADAARLADARGVSAGARGELARTTPGIVWLGYTVHGGEASGTEAAIGLLYQLAAGRDAETRMILDSLIVLIDPVQNPDGHERHVQDVTRARGDQGVPVTPGAWIHQGAWPGPRTSHYYFDLNRDWFIHSHPETRGRVTTFLTWWPHVAVDLHEMGSNSTYFFAPPMEPVNKNVHQHTYKWWDIIATGIGSAFDAHGWSFFRREGYDEFYPGYGVSWPILNGAVGATYEQASSGGGAIRRSDGTVLTLHDAASHHYTAAWATLVTTARRKTERVQDYVETRLEPYAAADRGGLRAVVIERDGQGRADSLAHRLMQNGISVQRLRAGTTLRGATAYGGSAGTAQVPAGAYVVDLAQPQGRLARALLEPEAQLDSSFIAVELESRRTGQPGRFYDMTAWSLPYAFRVRAWGASGAVAGTDQVDTTELAPAPDAPSRGAYGYAFEAGSEASVRLLSALLADSARVWYAPRSFRSGDYRFPRGAFIVRTAANDTSIHAVVRQQAAAAGARVAGLASAMVSEGTDLGSNSVFAVRPPRVALLGGAPVSGNSFGFAWYAFDQRMRYPVTAFDASSVTGPALDDFNVLVVPSVSAAALERVLGDTGRDRVTG
ncbi:MAG: hypothetical protein M3373_01480, partial [Gemmatimonadota bacterium]|nr:hypothetical protein [Gemmatimonadota bacterium]